MRKSLFILLGMTALLAGCSEQSPLEPNDTGAYNNAFVLQTPGIVPDSIHSATLYLYCSSPSFQAVGIHRVNSPWSETSVTWNNFGAAYQSSADGSLLANTVGWISADVTNLVRGWVGGAFANEGMLLDQQITTQPRALFFSRDAVFFRPYLVVCYAGENGDTCEQFAPTRDASINQSVPDAVYGFAEVLLTGYADNPGEEYQSLAYFNLPVYTPPPPPIDTGGTDPGGDTVVVIDPGDSTQIQEPDENGCTKSSSWWLRHNGCSAPSSSDAVSELLPVWLGTPGGLNSVEITSPCQTREYLVRQRRPDQFAAVKTLLCEQLAAKLNIASGADDAAIENIVIAVDEFLAARVIDSRHTLSRSEMRRIHQWQKALQRYNHGEIGPGRCGLQ